VGMGFSASKHPIPLLTSPLKGEENTWLKIGANQVKDCSSLGKRIFNRGVAKGCMYQVETGCQGGA
jgi:hypothetical protein